MDIEPSYRGYRFPAEIIAHCAWLYFRFCLSFRDVQEMMLERGIEVSYEAIRSWTLKFGDAYTWRLRRRRARPGVEGILSISVNKQYRCPGGGAKHH
jgi:putative transposase